MLEACILSKLFTSITGVNALKHCWPRELPIHVTTVCKSIIKNKQIHVPVFQHKLERIHM